MEKNLKVKERSLGKIPNRERFLKEEVMAEDIAKVVSNWTGIPVTRMLEEESRKLARIEKELAKRVVGQEEAIQAISRAIKRARVWHFRRRKANGIFYVLRANWSWKNRIS